MRVLAAVVEIPTLAMLDPWENLALGRTIALQLVGNDDAGNICEALEELAKKLLGGLLIAPALDQNVEHMIVLVDSAPQVMALAIHRQEDLVQMPFVARLRTPPSQPIGVVLPKLPTPLTDRFMGHSNAAFEQELFHIAVAQGEAIIEPDPMADDFARKAVVLVAFADGGRGHVGLPILEFEWSGRDHHQGNYVMGQEVGSTS